MAVDSVDEVALRVMRGLHARGSTRSVVVTSALSDTDLLAAVEAGVCAIIWRHEATASRLAQPWAVRVVQSGPDRDASAALIGEDAQDASIFGEEQGAVGKDADLSLGRREFEPMPCAERYSTRC